MVFFFKKKDAETPKKIAHLHGLLSSSFTHVKSDIHTVFGWLNYFNQKFTHHEQQLQAIQNYLASQDIKSEVKHAISEHNQFYLKHNIKEVLDEYYSFQDLNSQIQHLHSRINDLHSKHTLTPLKLDELKQRIEAIEQKKQDIKQNLREKLLKKITRNSKDYIQSIIFSLIKKYGKVSGLQLKEMVVDEQGLCSKSSFYRILAEIERDSDINMVWEGKEKSYFYKEIKHN